MFIKLMFTCGTVKTGIYTIIGYQNLLVLTPYSSARLWNVPWVD